LFRSAERFSLPVDHGVPNVDPLDYFQRPDNGLLRVRNWSFAKSG
jgi:hypothetical protein